MNSFKWTTHDGTPETLPPEGVDVAVTTVEGETHGLFRSTFCAPNMVWRLEYTDSVDVSVGDKWLPIPTPEQCEAVQSCVSCLEELYALVMGECPTLLEEDQGGDARLDMEIIDALAKVKGITKAVGGTE